MALSIMAQCAAVHVRRSRGVITVLALALTGCASANLTYLANGQPAYQVNCAFGFDGLNGCYRKAAAICGSRGFALYDWQGHSLPLRGRDPSEVGAAEWEDYTILTACRP